MSKVAFERGRNDRRDGRGKEDCPYNGKTESDKSHGWLNGWTLQDSIIRNDMTYPSKLGKEAGSKGHNSDTNPYPMGTKSYDAWSHAFTVASEAKAAKAENKESVQ
jgi:ribosome modulation factor